MPGRNGVIDGVAARLPAEAIAGKACQREQVERAHALRRGAARLLGYRHQLFDAHLLGGEGAADAGQTVNMGHRVDQLHGLG